MWRKWDESNNNESSSTTARLMATWKQTWERRLRVRVCASVVTFTEIHVKINLFASIQFRCRSFSTLWLPPRALNQLITLNHLVELKWLFYPHKLILIGIEINIINIFFGLFLFALASYGFWLAIILNHFVLAIYNFLLLCLLFI